MLPAADGKPSDFFPSTGKAAKLQKQKIKTAAATGVVAELAP
jgi:hypothetical protein